MDGTLTEPRCTINQQMIDKLLTLLAISKIGIVTGSDFDYVQEQCKELFNKGKNIPGLLERLTIYPCNGTKVYKWSKDKKSFYKTFSADMISTFGQNDYNRVLQQCLTYQLEICLKNDLPFTGTFLHYRGSMLNWCPIGRVAGKNERESWIKKDEKEGIRHSYLEKLSNFFSMQHLSMTVALGGSTSFDIYPAGWDKTYVLKHVQGHKLVFVGDKCKPGGNDHTIYNTLEVTGEHESYSTCSPAETISIIDKYI